MGRTEQVDNAVKVEIKLDNEGLRLLFGAESPTFYSLLTDGLLLPVATDGARLEDHLGLAAEPSCALACWIVRVLISLHWWMERSALLGL